MKKVLFAGNTDFSAHVLCEVAARFEVVGVVVSPDRPAGRGLKLKEVAVASWARQQGLRVFKPQNLSDKAFLGAVEGLCPEVMVVVAFRKIPEELWRIPPLGTVNLHTSLLPDYRGAAPIQHAIIHGDDRTGLTTFLINERIDTGDVLLQREIPIAIDDDFGTIYHKMMPLGADLVCETVHGLCAGALHPVAQATHRPLRSAPKITSDFCKIKTQTHTSAVAVYHHIRGLAPKPGAWMGLAARHARPFRYKVLRASLEISRQVPTAELRLEKERLGMVFADGIVWIEEGQAEGKKIASAASFINAWKSKGVERLFWE